MKKFIVAFYMIMLSAVIVAQTGYSEFAKDTRSYFANYTNNQVVELYANHYKAPSVAQQNRIYLDKDLIRIGIPYPKEIKRINKKIEKRNKEIRKREKKMTKQWEKDYKKAQKEREKRNKEIRKQNEKNRKKWEKENKKARKEREKQIKKQKKQIKKIGKWF